MRFGHLHEGFARVRCTNPDCKHETVLTFSCEGKWFCPNCHANKTIQFGEDTPNNILYPVPHRQFVASIPIMLRIYFKYERNLLTRLYYFARESLEVLFRILLQWDWVSMTVGQRYGNPKIPRLAERIPKPIPHCKSFQPFSR